MQRLITLDIFNPNEAAKTHFDNHTLMMDVFDIRRRVFVVEQNVSPEEEYEFEEQSNHCLVTMGGKGIACGRWRKTEKGIKIERMAVLSEYRGKGAGALVLKALIADLPETEYPVYLHAQTHAQGFYEKAEFVAEGELFYEAEIPHYKMVLK